MPRVFRLTRPELSEFLSDPRKIREFERLFDAVTGHDATIDVTDVTAGDGLSAAQLALGLIQTLQDLVELLSRAPVPVHVGEAPLEPPTSPVVGPEALEPPVVAPAPESALAPPVVPAACCEQVTPVVPVVPVANDPLALPPPASLPNDLWLAAMAPAPVPLRRKRYGSFHSQITQNLALGVETAVQYEVTDVSHGVWQSGDKFTVDTEGVYNVQFSFQMIADAQSYVFIFLRVNGVDVPWTGSQVNIKNSNDYQVPAWNWFLRLNANDYVQIFCIANTHAAQLLALEWGVPPTWPNIPSVIVTVQDVTGDQVHGGDS